jgi:hypothetical protein
MKKLIAIIAAAVSLTAFTTEAHADRGCGSRTFLGYDSCGNSVYRVRYVADYDCDGYPVYGYRREIVRRPRCDSGYDYDRGYSHDRGYHRGHGHGGHRRAGISFHGRHGGISIDLGRGRRSCR